MDDIVELNRSLGRVEGKLDSLISLMASHVASDEVNFTAVNSSVTRLRTKGAWFIGVASGAGAIVSLVLSFLRG